MYSERCNRESGISIHVPRERDDDAMYVCFVLITLFQSTSLVRGTTLADHMGIPTKVISIHVPRERDDSKNVAFCNKLTKAICANRSKEEL